MGIVEPMAWMSVGVWMRRARASTVFIAPHFWHVIFTSVYMSTSARIIIINTKDNKKIKFYCYDNTHETY